MVVLKGFIAVILSILVVFIAPAYAQAQERDLNQLKAKLGTFLSEIQSMPEEIKSATENSTNNPNKAYLMIVSNTTWQAAIIDSENDATTIDGTNTKTLEFECTPGLLSTYSVTVQKQTEPGILYLALLQGGPVIDKGSTTAQYGIVSLSGECNKPG